MNSFIFNSRYYKKYLQLERMLRLRHLVICISFFITTILASCFLNYYHGCYVKKNYRTMAVDSLSERTEVLLLGASHFFSGIDPNKLSIPSMSLSSGSLNYATQFAILNKCISKTPNLKLCILELDRVPFTINTIDNRIHRFKGDFSDLIDLGLTYWDIPDLPYYLSIYFSVINYRLIRPLVDGPKVNIAFQKTKFIQSNKAINKSVVKPGFFTTTATLEDYWRLSEISKDNRAPSIYDKADLNRNALYNMIQYLENQDIRIIFIRFPRYFKDSKDLNKVKQVAKTATKYPIKIYDFEYDKRFDESDFRDPNHLNLKGAAKFTKIIDRLIGKTLTLTNDSLD